MNTVGILSLLCVLFAFVGGFVYLVGESHNDNRRVMFAGKVIAFVSAGCTFLVVILGLLAALFAVNFQVRG